MKNNHISYAQTSSNTFLKRKETLLTKLYTKIDLKSDSNK